MRNVSVVFRILLLPIFLVRFCLPRPPETVSNQLRNVRGGLHGRNSRFNQFVKEVHFTEMMQNDNDRAMLNTDPAESKNLRHSVRLLKMKKGKFVDGHTTIHSADNAALSISAKSTEQLNRNKLHTFGSNSILFGDLNGNQHVAAPVKKHRQTVSLPRLHVKLSTSKDALEIETAKASSLKNDRSLEPQSSSLQHSVATQRESNISGFRTKRAVNETADFKQASSRTTPPEYMVHLFQLLSGTHYETLRNFVVTGFVNINKDTEFSVASTNATSRKHNLIFDVNIPFETETIHYVELRLYLVHLGQETTDKCDSGPTDHHKQTYRIRIFEKDDVVDLGHRLLTERTVTNVDNTWVSFNMTAPVQRWLIPGLRALEIDTVFCGNCTNLESNSSDSCQDCSSSCISDLAVNLNDDHGKGPILVTFSRKTETSVEVPHRRDVRDTMKKQGQHQDLQLNPQENDRNSGNASSGGLYFQGLVEFISATSSDLSNNLHISKTALLQNSVSAANFVSKQTDTHKNDNQIQNTTTKSTFLNPKDNQPLTSNISSKHQPSQTQRIGTKMEARNNQNHLAFLKEDRLKKIPPGDGNSKLSDGTLRMRLRRDTKARYRRHLDGLMKRETHNSLRRHKRSKKKRVSCQRNEMYVDFENIKWDRVIIFPRGYQAFECVGKCYTPISEFLTPTKHAIIQTLWHTSYPEKASRACCVPTKLEPISILYWDDNGDIKYDYTYEGMVAAECGCR